MKRGKSMRKAEELWPVLVERASGKTTITYAEVRDILGYPTCQPLNHVLWNITWFCEREGYPPLTSIVVSQKTGLPSSGFTDVVGSDVATMQQRVFAHDWSTISFRNV
jgi:hypothetical protein